MSIQPKGKYFVDAENVEERKRLAKQGRLLQQRFNGHLPEYDLPQTANVLDIACGDGAWALDVAHAYPAAQVTGIDVSKTAIASAQEQVREQERENVDFRVMDVTKGLDFPDSSFDLVNARLVFGFLTRETWPIFVQECLRILRPGGVLRLTEGEHGLSNGAAAEKLAGLCTQSMFNSGKSYSPDGRHTGITPMLPLLLRNAGLRDIQSRGYAIEYQPARDAHGDLYANLLAFYKVVEPILVMTGAIAQEEFDQVYGQFKEEMESEHFCLVWYYLSVYGKKPPVDDALVS